MTKRFATPRLEMLVTAWTLLWIGLVAVALPARVLAGSRESEPPGATGAADDDLFEPSNTGYIDSSVVRNRLRARLDASFDSGRPDRAEFIYGKCLCFSAFGQDAKSPGPTTGMDSQEVELSYERILGRLLSIFVEVPFRSVHVDLAPGFEQAFGSERLESSGLGDVRIGIKRGLIAEPGRHLTLQLRAYLDTGDEAKNLGTGHLSLEPAILFLNELPGGITIESEGRWWTPLSGSSDPLSGASIRGSDVGRIEQWPEFFTNGPGPGPDAPVRNDAFAGDVFRFGIGLSRRSRRSGIGVSPVVELVTWYVVSGFATPDEALPRFPIDPATLPFESTFIEDAGGTSIVNLKLGVRLRGRRPGSIYLGYGRALTAADWYDNILRVEFSRPF